MAAKDYDHLFKFLIIGDSGVGKSCILQRFVVDTFPSSYVSTVGVDFKIQTLKLDGERIKLQIWDTAGQERYRTITSTYYRGTHGVIVVYDITNRESFLNIKKWLYEIDQNCDYVPKILVGNKIDSCHEVSREELKYLADYLNLPFIECSAKHNTNISEIFETLTKQVVKVKKDQLARQHNSKPESIKLTSKSPKSKKRVQKKC
ncbi:hypothetical protein HELRODRAFT_185092 [Helobdella robusta]|uniref:SOCS box domain-containing protein n=1 Tax=Helobdella robusta TaxID=6412 RepID=T1FMD9_HELRO|nr:hypothetical protein HELRODRAFT_185092 [Helobdella robusta]ESN96611.1 hypothetical protein HELRODRAFT_185092 [Helobdella robusta]